MAAIQTNTPNLEEILATVNSLPEGVDTTGTAVEADIYILVKPLQ